MSELVFWPLVALSTALLMGLLFSPVANFLWRDGTRRRQRIVNTFSETSIDLYFRMFEPGDPGSGSGHKGGQTPHQRLKELYDARYGPKRYLGPSVLIFGVAGVSVFWALFTAVGMAAGTPPSAALPAMPDVAIAAVAGAYMWVVSDMQQRLRASDLGWQQLTAGALRFVIAIPAAYAFGALAADAAALPVAFLLGAFPTRTIMKIARRSVRGQLKMEESADPGRRPMQTLQGIDIPVAERFEEESITSIPQLAYCDVIDLTIRTGYAFTFVVDCSSQALAWLYLEDHLTKLRVYGLRGAQEIGNLIDAVDSQDARAVEVLAEAAPTVELEEASFEHTLREIAGDPYTVFLRDIWQTTSADMAVHITSLLPDPVGADRDNEEVVLRNDSDTDLPLDGWWLRNKAGKTFTLSGTVAARSRQTVSLRQTLLLTNTGDEVTLLRPDGSVAEVVEYEADHVQEGQSITFAERRQKGTLWPDGHTWAPQR